MADEKDMELAKQVYKTICDVLESQKWNYEKEEDKLLVYFGVSGENNMPMHFLISVDSKRELIRLLSPMPYEMSEEKRVEGAIATCAASYGMVDGHFDYDISDGKIVFRMTASYRQSLIGQGLIRYMIDCSCAMVEKYHYQFLAIKEGIMSIADFIEKA